ncbi:RNA-guided pseudouridylation complex pseudouridine synthase subunit Cbf5 [Candidatus Woesearchaeota archaeon]|nr:RNA-guided pseudouridylation complex pseudouridine synthase subunit Cbf5 [Candidatus Woesearchaeota archaeon]
MDTKLPFEEKKRDILIKKNEETNPNYGHDPYNRTTEDLINYGVICVDKPQGPTSHQVSAYVKQILNVNKSGHSGSLDPNVTGLLVIATGNATRVVEALLKAGKEYVCVMHLHKEIPTQDIKKVMKKFEGKIRQLPPLKSAVKRQYRYRRIYYNEILEISEDNKDVLFRTGVQAGTYIRKLVHDIGQELNCGAHMAELRRTKVACFNEQTNLATLHDLKDAYSIYKELGNDKLLRKYIKPMEYAVSHLPKIWVRDSAVNSICHGASLNLPGIAKLNTGIEPDLTVAVMTLKDELIAIGSAKLNSEKMLKDEKGLAIAVEKVFMDPNAYPKISR